MSSICNFSFESMSDHYDVLSVHNIEDISEARIVCLGECHGHKRRAANGSLISLNAKLAPVAIFCEGIPADDKSFDKLLRLTPKAFKRFKEMNLIDPDVPDENIRFFGWDVLDLSSECSSIKKEEPLDSTVSKLKILQDESLARICSLIPEFTLEGFKEVGFYWMMRLSKDDYNTFLQEVKNLNQISKDLKNAIDSLETFVKDSEKLIGESFPRRVDSMVRTVQKISQMQADGSLPALAFIIAGQRHFEESSIDAMSSHSLSSWHHEIALHKAIILCEKEMHSIAKSL